MTVISQEPWYVSAQQRAVFAFNASRAIGDRGAMLRELCRLHGGYLDVATSGVVLTANDLANFARFGLKRVAVSGGDALIIDDVDALPIEGLADVLRLDPAPRQTYPPSCADALLLRHTPFDRYRAPTQKAAVRALATMPDGATLLATLPTGAGKSLLFQIAPLFAGAPGSCCVVIVPTVALALAHVGSLRAIPGLEASQCIHGGQGHTTRSQIYDAFGRGEVPVLVLSPEVALGAARTLLIEAAQDPATKLPGLDAHLTTFFVDEAHIIESWGRSFRPDFQRLPGLVEALRESNPGMRTVLLSATVNDAARAELKRAYGTAEFLAVEAKVARYEFDLVHSRIDTAAERDAMLVQMIDRLPRPAIIYTTLVKHAESLYRAIAVRGYNRLALFTGQVDDGTSRLQIVQDWRDGNIDLVVATSAFGMGIDKDDVRAVIHACVPESPSRYYQEIGRAARDGNQALALMLWTDDRGVAGDWRQARRLWSGGWLRPPMMLKRWRAIVRAAETLGESTIVSGVRRLVVPLDAAHEDLDDGDTDYNRDWNRSLLNMLQRAGAIAIMATESRGDLPVWHVEVREPLLLDSGANEIYWAGIAELRTKERLTALSDIDNFKAAVFNPKICVSAAIFELVEAGSPLVPPCGRCGFCRKQQIAPPRLDEIRFEGVDRRWPHSIGESGLRPGISILHPTRDDGTISDDLIEGLVDAGIEQFVVHDHLAGDFARRLVAFGCRYGLVSSHGDMQGDWRPALLPTAIFIDGQSRVERLIKRIENWAGANPTERLVIVAPPETSVRGKLIVNILSSSAPISEAALRNFAKEMLPQ
ncbi:helicase-related protein [Neorhizobium galegae]|uniref:helicase-related protein n=1 Tax=Neorhizobium galegae TaxID=399 RepID=UPI002103F9EB|nr:helicase-related protein [Neorhizobium galegae]MCQ1852471.1 DEAD/DEAH box helicase [Neorhizobium galegae]